ncbi:MAG: hypothetical protein U0989_05655 [Azonexus sp.]|nr:hypothetical protein [Azonexus sp.]MDP3639296.1 hypothetical protein [Azonexus sp.]MDZ4314234.1 hypothetical protein [Azonexus sp.]
MVRDKALFLLQTQQSMASLIDHAANNENARHREITGIKNKAGD